MCLALLSTACFRGDYLDDLKQSTGDGDAGSSASTGGPMSGTGTTAGSGDTTGAPTLCGNGDLDPGEACDDGNTTDADGCDADCSSVTRVVDVVAGGSHTCVLFGSGAVRCWGDGSLGQLGLPGLVNVGKNEHPCEAPLVELGGAAAMLSTQADHTCALLEDGSLRCWGANDSGQLGYGDREAVGDDETPASAEAVPVVGEVEEVATGEKHTCVVLVGGEVRCWGAGKQSQLGVGQFDVLGANLAQDVDLGGDATHVAAGRDHTCALLDSGEVRCWGRNDLGQLGYPDEEIVGSSPTPAEVGSVDVGALVDAVSLGLDHTCVVTNDKDLYCWGAASSGQLGTGSADAAAGQVDAPAGPVLMVPTTQVELGAAHTCATHGGDVRCWGEGIDGRLGYPGTISIDTATDATPISLRSEALEVSAGGNHTCTLLDGDLVQCWGLGSSGQLGLANGDSIGDDESPSEVDPVRLWGSGC